MPIAVRKLEKSLKPISMGKAPHKELEFRMSKYNQIPVQVGMPDLRLMQNFSINASQTLILGPNTSLWKRDAPELAFKVRISQVKLCQNFGFASWCAGG